MKSIYRLLVCIWLAIVVQALVASPQAFASVTGSQLVETPSTKCTRSTDEDGTPDGEKAADSSTSSEGRQSSSADSKKLCENVAPASDSGAQSAADPGQNAQKPKGPGIGTIFKANVKQTFTLDPRLKKDLDDSDNLLRPIKLEQNRVAVGYNPSITWTRDPGGPWERSYDPRELAIYVVGPITQHLSEWIQMTPQMPIGLHSGFFNKFELFQGLANYGTANTFVQIKGGQCYNWQNTGWGGADRTVTLTAPGVYNAINAFDPTNPAKTISLDVTGLNWTSGRVFGYWQPNNSATSTSADPNIAFHQGYGGGLTFEKLVGRTGISGLQSNLTIGNSPVYNGNIQAAQHAPFVWWTSWLNKSFQDRDGYVRANPSFGLSVFGQRRYFDDPMVSQNPSRGYGYTFDLLTIPVRSYYSVILRYDQYRATNLDHWNTMYTFTIGQALDFHLPDKGRLRVSLDYQFIGERGSAPSNAIILGFWPVW